MREETGHTNGNLSPTLSVLLSNLNQHGLIHELSHILSLVINLILVSEWRVASHKDAFGSVIFAEFRLLKPGTEDQSGEK